MTNANAADKKVIVEYQNSIGKKREWVPISKIFRNKRDKNGAIIRDKDGNSQRFYLKDKLEELKSNGSIKFDTGGYTGAWFNGSKDGRLAWLHQKELILNETDTPKILDAVKTVRELSTGSISRNIENQLANTIASLENSLLRTYSSIDTMAEATTQSQGQFLEQAVQIDASFPGVRDSREIEDALKNLVNVASQYAYERK